MDPQPQKVQEPAQPAEEAVSCFREIFRLPSLQAEAAHAHPTLAALQTALGAAVDHLSYPGQQFEQRHNR